MIDMVSGISPETFFWSLPVRDSCEVRILFSDCFSYPVFVFSVSFPILFLYHFLSCLRVISVSCFHYFQIMVSGQPILFSYPPSQNVFIE